MKIYSSSKKAFTLVEIMIVVAIIGMLAALAVPNLVRAREQAQLTSIISNLALIENAKDQWATENKKSTGDTPTSTSLAVYMRNNKWISPVAHETYNINAIGSLATASGFKLVGKTQATSDGTSM